MTTRKSKTIKFLEKYSGGPLTVGGILEAHRLSEQISQVDLSKQLNISKAHLCDIEKGRRRVSPERAALFAKLIGANPEQLIRLSLQELIDQSGLKFKVELKVA